MNGFNFHQHKHWSRNGNNRNLSQVGWTHHYNELACGEMLSSCMLWFAVLLTLVYDHSRAVSANGSLIEKALRGQFVIPDFESFREKIDQLYQESLPITDGEVSATAN